MRYCATIGFFDGVHRGHQYLIGQLKEVAATRHEKTMIVTFGQHPRQTLQPGWQPQLLSTQDEKRLLLEAMGIDHVEMLSFTKEMAQLSARAFMEQLHEVLGVDTLLTGYDNRFGHHREEGFDDYVRYGRELGIEVACATPFNIGEKAVSSSRIRQLLTDGCITEANDCLGRFYAVSGVVEHGEQIGRRLGFPTANLHLTDDMKMIPKDGVYAVCVDGAAGHGTLKGITNIGTRPTFEGTRRTLETNIFNYNDNLYHQHLTISFIARLRDEKHFDSAEALALQMHADAERAQTILKCV